MKLIVWQQFGRFSVGVDDQGQIFAIINKVGAAESYPCEAFSILYPENTFLSLEAAQAEVGRDYQLVKKPYTPWSAILPMLKEVVMALEKQEGTK